MVKDLFTIKEHNAQKDKRTKYVIRREQAGRKLTGNGMLLDDLVTALAELVALDDTDITMQHRTEVVLKDAIDPQVYVITELRIQNNKVVLVIDPEY